MMGVQSMEGANSVRYPPYSDANLKRILWLTGEALNSPTRTWLMRLAVLVALVGIGYGIYAGVRR